MGEPIIGYADLHCHPMSHLGFGGRAGSKAFFWGEPTGPLDPALPCCRPAHAYGLDWLTVGTHTALVRVAFTPSLMGFIPSR